MDQNLLEKNLKAELGIDSLPEEIQEEVVDQFTEVLMKKIALKIFESLSEERRSEFLSMQAEGDEEKIQAFLEANIVNFVKDTNQIIQDAKEEYKDIVVDLTKN